MAAAAAVAARIVIVGAGFSGIGIAVNLKKRGYDDFIILERSDSFGGVWHKNRYPGAACDVPAHLYSFSFEPRAAWRQKYASQAEILRYLVHCASKYGLEPHIRFGVEVTEALWDEPKHRWIVRTSGGHVIEARALITATGQLSRPSYPSLPGLERFASPLFHSAEWQDHDLDGKSVAVIGTGASAIQIVPMIAPRVNKLYVFQRSAAYVLPKSDTTYSARQIQLFKRCGSDAWLSICSTSSVHSPSSPGAQRYG